MLKADDDTYVVVTNLLARLRHLDPGQPSMLGHLQTAQGATYHRCRVPAVGGVVTGVCVCSGGPGYVMTRAAFSRLVTEGLLPGGRQLCARELPHPRGQVGYRVNTLSHYFSQYPGGEGLP